MKKIIISLFVIGMMTGLSNNLVAQTTNTDNASASAYATIVAPIAIEKSADLQFGTMIKGTGTVTVATTGVRTFSVDAMNPGNQGVTPAAAVFSITGEASYTYSIAFSQASITITNAGSQEMEVGTFVAYSLTDDATGTTGTLSGGGTDTVKVGATLTLDNDETAGEYTGSFTVTVAYN